MSRTVTEATPRAGRFAYWRDAWKGSVPLGPLFFVDMLVRGTIINLTTTGVPLGLVAFGAPIPLILVLWASSWPWNVFLCISVWRSAANSAGSWSGFAGPLATLWAAGVSMV